MKNLLTVSNKIKQCDVKNSIVKSLINVNDFVSTFSNCNEIIIRNDIVIPTHKYHYYRLPNLESSHTTALSKHFF